MLYRNCDYVKDYSSMTLLVLGQLRPCHGLANLTQWLAYEFTVYPAYFRSLSFMLN